MPIEIERRFLVHVGQKGVPINKATFTYKIEQYFIQENPDVRYRSEKGKYITQTKTGQGLCRYTTCPKYISYREYKDYIRNKIGITIVKYRTLIPLRGGLIAELDVFKGKLGGLRIVEVEFETTKQAGEFIIPKWFGREVTEEYSWNNLNLAIYGIPKGVV